MRGSSKGKAQRGQYLAGGLGPLQMASEPDTKRCASEEADPLRGVDMRRCASKDAKPRRGVDWGCPTSIGEGNECQQGRWAPKVVDWGVPHQLKKGTSANKDARP